jgi:prepilin-type N-terminal cleavage/methylation domain-containing protein
MRRHRAVNSQHGFTLLELIVSMGVMMIIMAALFGQIYDSQRVAASEEVKLDLFQESRDFMDQMARDLRTTGYPSTLNFSTAEPPNASTNAVGLVYLNNGDLWFEGSPDGSGNVSVVRYTLDTSTTNGCPCLKRSQMLKQNGDPLTGQLSPDYQTQVQNVSTAEPIFTAYRTSGTLVTLPIDLINNANIIADVNTLAVKLTVQSRNPDPKTGLKPSLTLMSTVKMNNCSNAYSSEKDSAMGCH